MNNTTFYYTNSNLIEVIESNQTLIKKKWELRQTLIDDKKRNEISKEYNQRIDKLKNKRSLVQKRIRKVFLKKLFYSKSNNTSKLRKYIKKGRKYKKESRKINLMIKKLQFNLYYLLKMNMISEKGKLLSESKQYPGKERNIRNTKRIQDILKKELEQKERNKVNIVNINYNEYMLINGKELFNLGNAKPVIKSRLDKLPINKSISYA